MEVNRILNDMQNKMSASGDSPKSFNTYKSCIRLFCWYFRDKHHPTHVSTKEIVEFISWVKINRSFSLARLCYWAIRYLYVEIENQPNKMGDLKPIRLKAKVKIPIDMDVILNSLDEIKESRPKAIVGLLVATAMRREEVAKLKIENILWDKNLIVVRGKGDKERIVPLPEKLKIILNEYLESLSKKPLYWFFQGEKEGHYISPDTVYRTAKKYLQTQTHNVRHSVATWLYKQGVPIKTLAEMLGHSNTKTTEIYVHISPEQISSMINPMNNYRKTG